MSSSALRYRVLLKASGMQDGPSTCKVTVADKLLRLNEYLSFWKTVSWKERISLEYPSVRLRSGDYYGICGDVFAFYGVDRHQLEFIQLPSSTRGIPPRAWSHRYQFEIDAYILCPEQDLLVLVQRVAGYILSRVRCIVS